MGVARGLLALAGAAALMTSQAAAQTAEELNARCVNLGKIYSHDEQVLACTRQLALPNRTPEQHAYVYNNRGNAFRTQREYGAAIADYDEAIRLNPNYENAYNNRGIANRAAGLADRAIADFDAALRLQRYDSIALYGRGLARQRKGDAGGGAADIAAARSMDARIETRIAEYGVR